MTSLSLDGAPPPQARCLKWSDEAFLPVRPGVLGATVLTEQLTITLYRYEPHSSWEEHSHNEDQVTIVMTGGEITFNCAGSNLTLAVGDVALIQGGVPHSAVVGDHEVVTLNIFPPRSR
jgi:quercetin dioxygenase-like cupin family protein